MATVAEIQAEQQRVSEELEIVAEKLRATKGTDDSLFTQRAQLRRRQGELRAELAVATNQSPATGIFQGVDANTGLYFYKNPVTGDTFRSGTAPTVEQQQASGVRLEPPVTQPEPAATASQAASEDGPQGPTKPAAAEVSPSGRIVPPPDTSTPTNAVQPPTSDTGGDRNTNPPVRTTEQTQATNGYDTKGNAVGLNVRAEDGTLSNLRKNPETGELYNPGGIPGGVDLTTNPGTPTRDDAKNNSTTTAQTEANAANNTTVKIVPRPNVLDEFYSYTYSASVYLLNPAQYRKLLGSKTKKIDGYQLLFQTGGGPPNRGGVRPPPVNGTTVYDPEGEAVTVPPPEVNYPDGGRNPFFANDFYIDSITMETLPQGKGAGAAHVNTALKFTVVEPNGITLLDRLYDAVKNHAPVDANGKVNYGSAEYLMVIRFYGYNQQGQLVYPISGTPDPEGTSDSAASIEKFIPFKLKQLNWSVGSKLVSYEWDCVPSGYIIGGYTGRGTIPYDIQLTDTTVGGLLGGSAKYATGTAPNDRPGQSTTTTGDFARADRARAAAPATPTTGDFARADRAQAAVPAKADSAPTTKKTITQGLMGAMNDFQAKLVQDGIYSIADRYEIEFVGTPDMPATAISGAKLQLPNIKVDKSKTGSGNNNPQGIDPQKQSVDMVSRSFSIVAGQQLLQAIELVIRNSSYITDQALVVLEPNGTYKPNPNNRNKPMKWFTISMVATQIGDKIDPLRNDYAYNIKYVVAPFRVENFNSKYFPISTFPGVHKSYPYWFTGQNTAVLDYQETFNALYALTVSGNDPKNQSNAQREAYTASMAEIVKFHYDPRSSESSQQADGKSNEIGANAAEVLYSATDLKETKLKILGDPSWIMQGSVFRDVMGEVMTGKSYTSGFLPDGSVNFDASQVLFEINWQRPEDYDLSTGLADPYSVTQKKYNERLALQSRVYLCKKVVSEFRQGRFEQTLEGAIYLFPKPDKTNAANPAAVTSDNVADTGRPAATSGLNPGQVLAGPELTDDQALAARAAFAAKDSRRLDIGDGGKAAILGAQGAYRTAQFGENAGGAAFGNPSITRQGITAGATQLLPAGSPAAPTDGTGGTVGTVAEEIGNGPPKLPNTGRPITPGSLRDIQRQAQLARQNAPGTNPSTTTNPATQQIVKD
jgi:hypothetical protein